jgi:signal transduction histidine kinase
MSSNKSPDWKKLSKANLIFRAADSPPALADCSIFSYSDGWVIFGENIKLKEGEIVGKMNILLNELSDLNREVVRQKRELEELNAVKNRFLGMAAHDLRNPAGYIESFSSIMLDSMRENLTDEQLEIMSLIYETSSFMHRIVDDLLDISKIEAGVFNLDMERIDLRAFLAKSISLNNIMAHKKGMEIDFIADTRASDIWADRYKLIQVMNNLLSNAIKFSNPGGEITVRAADDGGEAIRISIKDSGVGMPSGEMNKLFKPFNMLSVKATGGEQSTGLGMVIVKNIIEAHGGAIKVDSEPAKGTTVSFTIPIKGKSDLSGQYAV